MGTVSRDISVAVVGWGIRISPSTHSLAAVGGSDQASSKSYLLFQNRNKIPLSADQGHLIGVVDKIKWV